MGHVSEAPTAKHISQSACTSDQTNEYNAVLFGVPALIAVAKVRNPVNRS
jgi:hypothetical protein